MSTTFVRNLQTTEFDQHLLASARENEIEVFSQWAKRQGIRTDELRFDEPVMTGGTGCNTATYTAPYNHTDDNNGDPDDWADR